MLHFYQCQQCLSLGTNETKLDRKFGPNSSYDKPQKVLYKVNASCNACQGDIWYLGEAREDFKRLQGKVERTACDKRCTHATGPVCVCKCYCKNHGKGTIVEVLTDLGPIPQLSVINKSAAIERADQIKKLLDKIEDFINNDMADYKARYLEAETNYYDKTKSLPHLIYSKGNLHFSGKTARYAKNKVMRAITDHDNRLKHLNKVLAELEKDNLDFYATLPKIEVLAEIQPDKLIKPETATVKPIKLVDKPAETAKVEAAPKEVKILNLV